MNLVEDSLYFYKKSNNFKDLGFNDVSLLQKACQYSTDFNNEYLNDIFNDEYNEKKIIYAQYKKIINVLNPIGFAIVKKTSKGYKIELLCSQKGNGKYLLNYLKYILCEKSCEITLESVNSARDFYFKNDFVVDYRQPYTGYTHYIYVKKIETKKRSYNKISPKRKIVKI